jgi:hypothetical protein
MAPDQLARFRAAVADEAGAALAGAVARMQEAGLTLWGDALKTAPRGVPRDHPRIDLLRLKDLLASDTLGPEATLDAAGRSSSPARSGTARARS